MRSDPTITVTCDKCQDSDTYCDLTATAGHSWDERGVDGQLRRAGWKVDGEIDICPDCSEEDE